MKFARWTFNLAGAYGVLTVAPLYFVEGAINHQDPPPITHPMFFYGFVGVTLAWQLLFFAVARRPIQLRLVIPFAALSKLSFSIAAMVLYARAKLAPQDLTFAVIDFGLAVIFLIVWLQLKQSKRERIGTA